MRLSVMLAVTVLTLSAFPLAANAVGNGVDPATTPVPEPVSGTEVRR
jgi:hypothetical protein